jgi:hypothetical protein
LGGFLLRRWCYFTIVLVPVFDLGFGRAVLRWRYFTIVLVPVLGLGFGRAVLRWRYFTIGLVPVLGLGFGRAVLRSIGFEMAPFISFLLQLVHFVASKKRPVV